MSTANEQILAGAPPVDPAAAHAPSALRGRVAAALERHAGGARGGDDAARAAACLAAGEALLGDVLGQPERSRPAALDLLAADALVTYAFELLASEPERLESVGEAALRRIAGQATHPNGGAAADAPPRT